MVTEPTMKNALKNFGLFAVAAVMSLLFAYKFAHLYQFLTGGPLGSYLDFSSVIGLMLAFPFFTSFFYAAFGDEYRYYFVLLFTFPFLFMLASGDLVFVGYLFSEALLGFAMGCGVRWVTSRWQSR